jgi:transposase
VKKTPEIDGFLIGQLTAKIYKLTEEVNKMQMELSLASGLAKENQLLKDRVADLEARLAQYETPKNSSNSSKPPSSDFPKPKKTQSLRESSGKKPGGQPGHKGNTLQMVETPDVVQELKPGHCSSCGCTFTGHHFVAAGRRQVIDIPPVHPIVTEYQIFKTICDCGYETVAEFPEPVVTPVSYGANIQAMVAYLSARQYMPVARIVEYFASVMNLKISTGGICYLLEKSKRKSKPHYEYIRQFVLDSPVVGADETGVNINGKNHWAWVFQSPLATFLDIHKSRGMKAINEIMPEGFKNTVLVTDCWASYFKGLTSLHQLCTAHLMRELIFFGQLYAQNNWSGRILGLIQNAIELRKKEHLTPNKIEEIKRTFTLLRDEPIDHKFKKLVTFQKRMVKYSDHVFYFLDNPEVPPDNNGSERALRNYKVKQKVSGVFRSIDGAKTFTTLRSVIDTAIKQGQNPYEKLKLISLSVPTE